MESNETSNTKKRLIKTDEQAQIALNILLEESEKQNLERGIYQLLEELNNQQLDDLLDHYPDLIQQYGLERLLSGTLEIPNVGRQELKTAGLLCCLQLLIHFCAELKQHSNTYLVDATGNNNEIQNIHNSLLYITKSVCLNDFILGLLPAVVSVTGLEYYERFQKKIKTLDLEQAIALEADPEIQDHIDLMIWFVLVRLFLESVYQYVETHRKFKNTAL
jgi:hypothetical protein